MRISVKDWKQLTWILAEPAMLLQLQQPDGQTLTQAAVAHLQQMTYSAENSFIWKRIPVSISQAPWCSQTCPGWYLAPWCTCWGRDRSQSLPPHWGDRKSRVLFFRWNMLHSARGELQGKESTMAKEEATIITNTTRSNHQQICPEHSHICTVDSTFTCNSSRKEVGWQMTECPPLQNSGGWRSTIVETFLHQVWRWPGLWERAFLQE